MAETQDLLIEIGSEELPPRALKRLSEHFASAVRTGLERADLAPGDAVAFATPRRLAVWAKNVPVAQADREIVKRGPAVTAAFDEEGCPTRAAEGFAASCGVRVEDLERLETGKGAWLAYRVEERGRPTTELLGDIIHAALSTLPIPKRMRWGAGDVEFIRPVHWVVVLFGSTPVTTPILGVMPGQETRGHRFHHPQPIFIAEPAAYAPLLESEGHVMVDMDDRREAIRAQVIEKAREAGGEPILDEDLLDEVTALVEWPVAVYGSFDPEFLDVPAEALISSMQDHQKYFPLVDGGGKLLPGFITISNIESVQPEQVRKGNERVIRPRLADAAFFWNQDRKSPLGAHAEALKEVVFQKKLGSLYDKQERIAALAGFIAERLSADKQMARRAGSLSKCDLLSQMVFEFPELQGIMGRYYALHDGEPAEIAAALDEQYMPRFAGDRLPDTVTGQCLAMADRVDTLLGIFAIGKPPTGDKDPFGLRRAALGVLRIMIEGMLDLDLVELLEQAASRFDASLQANRVSGEVFDYMMDRLRAYYVDGGTAIQVFEAVLARRPPRPLDFHRRVQACEAFLSLPEAESLAAANKRIRNILKKNSGPVPDSVTRDALVEPEEIALLDRVEDLAQQVQPQLDARDYTGVLQRLAELREPVDRFFDKVMVMAEDETLRANRLALLQGLNRLFLRVADISRLQA